jgi:uncharacterized membrane protein (DUF2068 family)
MHPHFIPMDPKDRRRRALRAVALLEFLKGIFVLLMGICALLLVRQDVWLLAESLLAVLYINTDRHFAQVFLDWADNLTDAKLWAAARIAFIYSGLRFTEGYGLWRQRAWAEWVAVISGTLLLPFEVRELLRGITIVRSLVFAANIAIILYMLHVLKTGRRERLERAEAAFKAEKPRPKPEVRAG